MSEAQRSALNALLFRTDDQSKDIVLALATNRHGNLDSAVADRIDEVLEFPFTGKLYLDKYIAHAAKRDSGFLKNIFRREQQKIEIQGLNDDIIREVAAKTEGFSGRWQVYWLLLLNGSEKCVLYHTSLGETEGGLRM